MTRTVNSVNVYEMFYFLTNSQRRKVKPTNIFIDFEANLSSDKLFRIVQVQSQQTVLNETTTNPKRQSNYF